MADMLTTAEVAHLLGVSIPTVNRRAASGAIPVAAKAPGVRGAYLFDRAAIEVLRDQPVVAVAS